MERVGELSTALKYALTRSTFCLVCIGGGSSINLMVSVGGSQCPSHCRGLCHRREALSVVSEADDHALSAVHSHIRHDLISVVHSSCVSNPASSKAVSMLTDRHRAVGMLTDRHRAVGMLTDRHRAVGMLTDRHRAVGMLTDRHRAVGMLTDRHRAVGMLTDRHRAVGMLTETGQWAC